MFPYVRLHTVGFFSFGIFKNPSWAIQLCWISLRSAKIYLVMDAIKDSAKKFKKNNKTWVGLAQNLHAPIFDLFSIDKQLVAYVKNDVNLWSLRWIATFFDGENMLNVDVANEVCASLENSPPQRNDAGEHDLETWWSKRLNETYEQTWMSGVCLPAGGPQKNWDAFLLASFLQIFRGQIFWNKFWHWLFGHPPESSNSSDVDATTLFLMTPFVRVARCAKRSCPFNRKGVSLGRMGWKKFGPDGQLTYTQNCVDFRYFLDVVDLWNSPKCGSWLSCSFNSAWCKSRTSLDRRIVAKKIVKDSFAKK